MHAQIKQVQGHASFDDRFLLACQLAQPAFRVKHFRFTLHQLVLFPERTSTAILRAEILPRDLAPDADDFQGFKHDETVRRRILPRRPALDKDMLQDCLFYNGERHEASLVLFEPLEVTCIPFYHPQVAALAFHYTDDVFELSYRPLDHVADKERLERSLLMLMQIIVKHATGYMNNYQKRVHHDQVVSKNCFQDTNQRLKRTYAAKYFHGWIEKTDATKHVFEDICIAAWLLELWKAHPFTARQTMRFVDVGCGNGLLVELLLLEGQDGYGFDLRARKSWSALYAHSTQQRLKEMVLLPEFLLDSAVTSEHVHNGQFRPDEFLIANHADELTPWIAILSALSTVPEDNIPCYDGEVATITIPGFLIIPCCMHVFSGSKHPGAVSKNKAQEGGRYAAYVAFLLQICEALGFVTQQEALRIPSTRNKAIVAMKRRLVEDEGIAENERASGRRTRLESLCRRIINEHGGAEGFREHTERLIGSNKALH
jgi:tRNASer (uridine44-2'-O)-methyltransferase